MREGLRLEIYRMRTDFRPISVMRRFPVTERQVWDTDPVVGLGNGI